MSRQKKTIRYNVNYHKFNMVESSRWRLHLGMIWHNPRQLLTTISGPSFSTTEGISNRFLSGKWKTTWIFTTPH